MKKFITLISIITVMFTSCDILEQMNEVKQFANCDFSVKSVQINKLGGFDFSSYKSIRDIGFTQLISLGQQLVSGNLPANLSVEILAKNNKSSKAAISGLDWQLTMKNENYGNGKLNQYVEVLPGQSTDFTVNVSFDLHKLLVSENLQAILDLVMDMDNKEKLQKLDIMLKVKPYYKSGNTIREYPGYLTIRP
ncbi:MAG: hypothetical protein HQ521_20960 [Bacteroidetes bacterium]|nr:hypothetical protein [Bacteroidota bacterium]